MGTVLQQLYIGTPFSPGEMIPQQDAAQAGCRLPRSSTLPAAIPIDTKARGIASRHPQHSPSDLPPRRSGISEPHVALTTSATSIQNIRSTARAEVRRFPPNSQSDANRKQFCSGYATRKPPLWRDKTCFHPQYCCSHPYLQSVGDRVQISNEKPAEPAGARRTR